MSHHDLKVLIAGCIMGLPYALLRKRQKHEPFRKFLIDFGVIFGCILLLSIIYRE